MADKGRRRVVGRLGRPLGGCEHGVALPNARGRITSKDEPWELAGQIAAGKGGGRWRVSWWAWVGESECLEKGFQRRGISIFEKAEGRLCEALKRLSPSLPFSLLRNTTLTLAGQRGYGSAGPCNLRPLTGQTTKLKRSQQTAQD